MGTHLSSPSLRAMMGTRSLVVLAAAVGAMSEDCGTTLSNTDLYGGDRFNVYYAADAGACCWTCCFAVGPDLHSNPDAFTFHPISGGYASVCYCKTYSATTPKVTAGITSGKCTNRALATN